MDDRTDLGKKWDLLKGIANEGATVVLKIDGERLKGNNCNIYTVVISGGKLGEDFFRKDLNDIDVLINEAIEFYNSAK